MSLLSYWVGEVRRLYPLTKFRSKPAVPVAGKYRLIDIPLSNCINSGLNRIYVVTQFNSVSLHRHIRHSYVFDAFSGGFVEILAAHRPTKMPRGIKGPPTRCGKISVTSSSRTSSTCSSSPATSFTG